jgi:hypothetical protein
MSIRDDVLRRQLHPVDTSVWVAENKKACVVLVVVATDASATMVAQLNFKIIDRRVVFRWGIAKSHRTGRQTKRSHKRTTMVNGGPSERIDAKGIKDFDGGLWNESS